MCACCTAPLSHQASRGHMKQLMSDLEAEQDKTASLSFQLQSTSADLSSVTNSRDVAEARVKTLQDQLSKANDASYQLCEQVDSLKAMIQVS